MKNKNIFWGIITLFIIVAVSFAHLFFKEPKPLVIFAGGGSVCNYLSSKAINLKERKDFPNSVYINMPSGYVEKLLLEEIERFGKENEAKHPILNISFLNNNIIDRNIESLKPFLFVGLLADTISSDSLPYSEYTQIYEYHIGKDTLAVYYVDDQQHQDTIDIDTLVKELMDTIKQRTIYTTSQNSGTRKAYERLFKENRESIELKKMLNNANPFFENDTIFTNSMVLSSRYYPPQKCNKKDSTIIKDKYKDLYIYFIGYKSHDNKYKPNSQVINFLNLCAQKIHKKENYFSKDSIWEIDSLKRGKIKKIFLEK